MYKIQIEQTKTVSKTVKGEWVIIASKGEDREYGFAPPIEKDVTEHRIIYAQEVDELNLVAVINAVNTPPKKME